MSVWDQSNWAVISTLIQMQRDKQSVAFQSFYLLTWKSLLESILWNLIQNEIAWQAYSTLPPRFTPFRSPERVYLPPQLIKSHSKGKCDTRPLIMTPERTWTEIVQINKLAQTNGGKNPSHQSSYGSDQRFLRGGAALPSPICIIAQCAILISEFAAYWKCKVWKAIKVPK